MIIAHRSHPFSNPTLAFTLLLLTTTVSAVTHLVGDSMWTIPPTTDFYSKWAASRTFHVGDILLFDFESEIYNFVKVEGWEHDICWDKIIDMFAVWEGPASFELTREGGFYFVCTMFNYCSLGMKLDVFVSGNTPSPDVLDGAAA